MAAPPVHSGLSAISGHGGMVRDGRAQPKPSRQTESRSPGSSGHSWHPGQKLASNRHSFVMFCMFGLLKGSYNT